LISRLLLRLLGFGEESAIQSIGLRSQWPPIALALAIAVAIAYTVWLYRRETRVSPARRVLLGVLRALVYIVVLVILFEPIIGIQTVVTMRRDLLVMFDKSESMVIKDARKRPEDVAAAAVALGKAKFASPARQEALARVRRAMQSAVEALALARYDDTVAAQNEAVEAIAAVMGADEGAASDGDGRKELDALRNVELEQNVLREACTALDKEGRFQAESLRQMVADQRGLADRVAALAPDIIGPLPAVSGEVRNQVADASRIELAQGLLSGPGAEVVDKLGEEFNLRWFCFGETLEPVSAEGGGQTLLYVKPDAQWTRGGEAIEGGVNRYSGQPIAGIVVLTDGAFNGVDPRGVALNMKKWGVPLYPVGIGLPAPDDVGLRSLIVQDVVFPKDVVSVRVQVFSHGYDRRKAMVKVTLDRDLMAEKEVELSHEPQFVEIPFTVPEPDKGSSVDVSKLEVSVTEQPDEVTAANNRIERSIQVMKEKIKVLYVEGKPRWEYRYLRAVLLRDRRLDVKFLMTQGDRDLAAASEQYLARYPEDEEDAFSYDLVILGDVPAQYFTSVQLKRVVELVRDRGGSLLMLAGDKNAPVTYVGSPIESILPVQITQDYEQVDTDTFPAPTAAGQRGLAMLEPVEKNNRTVWARVKPLYRVPRITGAKAANVVLELPAGPTRRQPYPLVAWQYAGTGKSMYVGTDQLWRLRFKRGDFYHARFWGQAIQFLALSRLLGENKRIRLETDKGDYLTGEQVDIHVNVLNEAFQPADLDNYTVHLERTGTGAEPVELRLEPIVTTPGLYHGVYTIEHAGDYLLRTDERDARYSNTVKFSATSSAREQLEPAMQENMLREIAELSGGRYFSVEQWPALTGAISGKVRTITEHKDQDLWDSWILFALLLTFGGLEWFLRRRFYLL